MKNFGIKLAVSVLFSVMALGAFAQKNFDTAYPTDTVYENNQVVYTPSTGLWSFNSISNDKIVLTKKISAGSGSYSEFFYSNNEPAFSFGSGFEFLYNDKLIAFDKYSLKFYLVRYDAENKTFYKKDLPDSMLEEIFHDVKIIKVSEFKDNEIHVHKMPFRTMKLLLVNDTPEYFYKYHFHGDNFETYNLFGLLEVNKMGTIEFHHPAPEFRNLFIKVNPF